VKYGDPVLEKPAATIKKFDTTELEQLVEDMFCFDVRGEWGWALAAPQIGKEHPAGSGGCDAGEKIRKRRFLLVNPEIIHAEGEVREERRVPFRFRDFAGTWCGRSL